MTLMQARLILVVVLVTLSAGCQRGASEAEPGGPLYAGETSATLCLPQFAASSKLTHGSDFVENTGDQTARLEEVALVEPRGLSILAAYTASVEDGLVGTSKGWDKSLGSELVPLGDVEPGVTRNLVLELEAQGDVGEASFAGVEVTYSVGSRSYVVRTPLEVLWKRSC